MFGVHRVPFLPKSPGHPNSVGGEVAAPFGVASTRKGINPPQSASLGDAVGTSLPLADDKFRFLAGLFFKNKCTENLYLSFG